MYNVLSTDQSAKSTGSNDQARCMSFRELHWSDFLHLIGPNQHQSNLAKLPSRALEAT